MLEPRVMFDGAAAEFAAETAIEAAETTPSESDDTHELLIAALEAPVAEPQAQEVAFIDGGLADIDHIIAGIGPDVDVYIIDPNGDGVAEIAAILAEYRNVSAIHILSHGESGSLQLGTAALTTLSMTGEHADDLATIARALGAQADILVYGCDFGAGESGFAAMSALAAATGADVAASDDVTGAAALGGDWDLEVKTGEIQFFGISPSAWMHTLDLTITNVGVTGATGLANAILGSGTNINSAVYSGGPLQTGTFVTGAGTSFGSNILTFTSGAVFSTGTAVSVGGPNSSAGFSVDAPGVDGDPQFNALAGNATFDGSFITITFTPDVPPGSSVGDTGRMTMEIAFGSDEYNEYVYGSVNDTMAVIVNGVNQSVVPNGLSFGIDTINNAAVFNPTFGSPTLDPNPEHTAAGFESANPSLYVNNAGFNTQMDGFTITLPVTFDVIVGQPNTIKMGIADSGDAILDSWFFVKADSAQTVIVAEADSVSTPANIPATIQVTANDYDLQGDTLTVTHILGQPVSVGSVVTLASGVTVTVGTGGNLTVAGNGVNAVDDTFTYSITDGNGGTSTAFVAVTITAPVANTAPVDGNETNTVTEDTTLSVADGAAGDLLNNATDAQGNPLSITSYTIAGIAGTQAIGTPVLIAGVGSITVNANGSYSFASALNYTGAVPVITYTVSDGALTDTSTLGLSMLAVNDPPIIDNDGDNSSGQGGFNHETTYVENAPSVPVVDADVLITDVDSGTLDVAVITLTNAYPLDSLQVGAMPLGIAAFVDTSVAGQITVTLTGPGSLADFQAALQNIRFLTTSENPDPTDRIVQITVNDGFATSNVATSIINVVPVNDNPTLDLDGNNSSGINGGNHLTSYTENAAPTPIGDGDTMILDLDDTNIENATITLTNGKPGDLLSIGTLPAGISLVGIAPTHLTADGTITIQLTGSASLADYQAAIEAVGFSSNSENIDPATRSVTVVVSDGAINSNTATASITIVPVNDAPVAADDGPVAITEDTPASGNVISDAPGADSDVEGDALAVTTFQIDTNGDGTQETFNAGDTATIAGVGTLEILADGSYTFTPEPNYNGAVPSAVYTITDGTLTDSAALSFADITDVNDPPVGVADLIPITEDTTVTTNVLGNDTDVDADPLTISAAEIDTNGDGTADPLVLGTPTPITDAAGTPIGTITVDANGDVTFDPAPDYIGPVPPLTYTPNDAITDGLPATVTFGPIVAVNDAPVAVDDGPVAVTEDTPLSGNVILDAPGADSDIDGGVLTVSTFDIDTDGDGTPETFNAGDTATIPDVGMLTVNADGSYTFTPELNYNGPVPAATYTITDGALTDTAVLAFADITDVNDMPVAVDDGPVAVTEDTPVSGNVIFDAPGADSDLDGDALAVSTFEIDVDGDGTPETFNAGDTATVPGVGTLTIGIDGSYTFTPAPNYNGPVPSATYTVTDGTLTDTAILSFADITDVNDAPVAVDDGPVAVTEDTPVSGNVILDAPGADSDLDGDALTVTTFEIDVDGDGAPETYNAGDTATITGVGSLVINADGSYTFAPELNYNGPVPAATYTITDGALADTAVLAFADIPDVNDAPVAVDDGPLAVTEDVAATGNVLGNDTDVDGDALTVTTFAVDVDGDGTSETFNAGDTAAIAGVGTLVIGPTGAYVFTPELNYNGLVPPVTYTVTDGTLTDSAVLSFADITDVNVPPVGVDDAIPVTEDTPVTQNVLGNDTDVDNDPLTITAAEFDSNGDGVAEPLVLGVATPITDASSNPIGVITVNPNGDVTFVPALDYIGPVPPLTYTPNDGTTDGSPATISFGPITPVNDTPVAVNDGPVAVTEDTAATGNVITDLAGLDSDIDGDALTVTGFDIDTDGDGTPETFNAGDTAIIAGVGTLTIGSDGSYTFTPALNYNGPVPAATYTITDGALTDTAVLAFADITDVNDAPVAVDDGPVAATEDVAASGNVLGNDSDVDGDALSVVTFVVDGDPAVYTAGDIATIAGVGTLVINADGSYSFTPEPDYNGPVPVATYTVTDGALSDTATLSIAATPVNDPPVGPSDGQLPSGSATDGATFALPLPPGSFTDPDNDTLVYSLAPGAPPWLSIDPATGEITGTVPADASVNGPYTLSVIATDPSGETASAVLPLTVANLPPVAVDEQSSDTEDTPQSGNVLDNDADTAPDSDALTVAGVNGLPGLVGLPLTLTYGDVTINPDGSWTFAPNANANGLAAGETVTETVTYQVFDGQGGFADAVLTIEIAGLNDAPEEQGPVPGQADNDGETITPLDVGAVFSDPDGDALAFTATGLPPGLVIDPMTGVITGTLDPGASQGGPYTVTVTSTDPDGNTASTIFEWAVTNPPPVAGDNAAATDEDVPVVIGVLGNDNDPDGDALTVVGATDPANGSVVINPDGTITYTPEPGFNGTDTFTYTISDGNGGLATATVSIGVVNDIPVGTPINPQTNDDAETPTLDVSGNFSDPDGQPLTFTATGLPPGLSLDPTTGVISGTIDPDASQGGP